MYGIIILAVYAVVMIGATLLVTKKESSANGFYVANRNMGVIGSGMSIAATWIWAPALFVSAEKAYSLGGVGLFWFLVPNVLCLLCFIPFAKEIRRRMPQGITLSGFMEREYKSEKVKRVYIMQLGSLTILSTAVQLLAGGTILASITGISFTAMTVILSVIAFAYAQFSGIRASILTDGVQMVFMIVACLAILPWIVSETGTEAVWNGLGGITGEYTSLFSTEGIDVFFAFGLPTAIGLMSGPFGDQCFWQRTFAVQEGKIKNSFILGAILFAIVPLSMGIMGLAAAGIGFEAVDTSIVNVELIGALLPAWVSIPFLFMIISGLLSTVDSNLCAVASLTTDLQVTSKLNDAEKMAFSKKIMLAMLLFSMLIAHIPNLTVTHLFLFYGTFRATTVLPTIFTLLGKKLSEKGICYGVMTSVAIGLPIFAYGNIYSDSLYKTLGSLLSVLLAGIVAVIVTRMEAGKNG